VRISQKTPFVMSVSYRSQ